jgi:enoyl-CoA hydratase
MSPTELDTLFHERVADGVVLITLNRPERGNGVVPELADDLMSAWDDFEASDDVRAVVLTGAGKQFSAGADIKAMADYFRDVYPRTHEPYNARVLFPVVQRIHGGALPVVAAVNGAATAGGLDLALACDIRICSDRARLGETYVRMGLPVATGGAWHLPKLVGPGVAAELALTGELVDAERALAIGLVNRVVEHESLIDEAVRVAAKIAARPVKAVEATRQALRNGWQTGLASALDASYWAVSTAQAGPDIHEGIAAFLEKREPRFNQPTD